MNDSPTPDTTRRDGVRSRPVRLADGGDWGLMLPSVRLTPMILADLDTLGRPVTRVAVKVGFGYPTEIQSLIDALRDSCPRGTVEQQYEAFFALSVALLCQAHEISSALACTLLSVSEGELTRLVRDVVAVITESQDTSAATQMEDHTIDSR